MAVTATRTRVTVASTNARIDALEAAIASLTKAVLAGQAHAAVPVKARTTRKASPKAPKVTQPKADLKPTKGAQSRETLSRKDWNRTLTAKARLAGKTADGCSVYADVTDDWARVQVLRAQGATPDEVLARYAA